MKFRNAVDARKGVNKNLACYSNRDRLRLYREASHEARVFLQVKDIRL